MKKAGLIISIVGLLIAVLAGVSFVTKEKVVDIGSIEMVADQNHTFEWSPYLGVGVLAIGIVMYLVGSSGNKN